jgi:hypothetical protein
MLSGEGGKIGSGRMPTKPSELTVDPTKRWKNEYRSAEGDAGEQ